MRAIPVLLLLLVGCGAPLDLTGGWGFRVNNDAGDACDGSLSFAQDQNDWLAGGWACTFIMSGLAAQGSVDGVVGETIALTFRAPGYNPWMVSAAATNSNLLEGRANGSGFTNTNFVATR